MPSSNAFLFGRNETENAATNHHHHRTAKPQAQQQRRVWRRAFAYGLVENRHSNTITLLLQFGRERCLAQFLWLFTLVTCVHLPNRIYCNSFVIFRSISADVIKNKFCFHMCNANVKTIHAPVCNAKGKIKTHQPHIHITYTTQQHNTPQPSLPFLSSPQSRLCNVNRDVNGNIIN